LEDKAASRERHYVQRKGVRGELEKSTGIKKTKTNNKKDSPSAGGVGRYPKGKQGGGERRKNGKGNW